MVVCLELTVGNYIAFELAKAGGMKLIISNM